MKILSYQAKNNRNESCLNTFLIQIIYIYFAYYEDNEKIRKTN